MSKTGKKVINILMAMTIAFALAICFVNVQHAYAEGQFAKNESTGETYDSLKEACDEAADGDTIVLIGNEVASEPFTIAKTITIDLKGHSYLNTGVNADNKSAITIGNGADVTIKDSSEDGRGRMTGQNILFYVSINDANWSSKGSLTIENGTYTCNGKEYKSEYVVIYNRGITTINGGSIINEGVNSTIYTGRNSYYDEEYRAKLTIKNATVQSGNAYAINSYGDTTLEDVDVITNAPKRGAYRYQKRYDN